MNRYASTGRWRSRMAIGVSTTAAVCAAMLVSAGATSAFAAPVTTSYSVGSADELLGAVSTASSGESVSIELEGDITVPVPVSLAAGSLVLQLAGHDLEITGTTTEPALTVQSGAMLRFVGAGEVALHGADGAAGAVGSNGTPGAAGGSVTGPATERFPGSGNFRYPTGLAGGDGQEGGTGDGGGSGGTALLNDGILSSGNGVSLRLLAGNGGAGGKGGTGGAGGVGGIGGSPDPNADSLPPCSTLPENAPLTFIGGKGGTAGKAGNGGNGGAGGAGGAALLGTGTFEKDPSTTFELVNGSAGDGGASGTPGRGGNGGLGGQGGAACAEAIPGSKGDQGNRGNDGKNGITGPLGEQGTSRDLSFATFVPRTGADLSVDGEVRMVSCNATFDEATQLLNSMSGGYPLPEAGYGFVGWADSRQSTDLTDPSMPLCGEVDTYYGLWIELTPASPIAPSLTTTSCGVENAVVIPKVEGVVYTSSRQGTTVTVTAAPAAGYEFVADAPASWELQLSTTACATPQQQSPTKTLAVTGETTSSLGVPIAAGALLMLVGGAALWSRRRLAAQQS